ncbi:hypothetical protein SLS62_003627 [Diatrype stigma]|uniref:Beta-glucuronidase C-terminal domain-containing protein n=1 Tax=Diatrype stigma TaxID=117547 RepID=A0AAN9V4H7_9PEZI
MSEPNMLTFNLIDNLANYTGKPPHVRIGGNTADYMVFDQSQNEWAWTLNDQQKGQGNLKPNHMIIGPRFFEAVSRFPPNTPLTWGLNMAYNEPDWEEEITTMAQQVIDRVKHLDLVSFELGNEPDLWLQNGFRSGQWGGRTYVEEWLTRAEAVWTEVLKPNHLPSNMFEIGCTASTVGTDFQIRDLMSFDANRKVAGSDATYIGGWNQHDYYYFIGVSSYPITLEYLMRLATTEVQFKAWVEQVEQSKATQIPYVVREMGIIGPLGLAGISDVFGGALWTLNFLLYSASLGVSSVQFHMTDNSDASAWQPIQMLDREPFVRPLYYGMAAFDQIIGPTCAAQVSQSQIASYPPGYDEFVRAYNVYQDGHLDSLVVVNGKMANVSEPDKASIEFSVQVPSSLSGQMLYLSYLTSDGADATNGTTWNGISYEVSGDGTPTIVSDDNEVVEVSDDGTITIMVRDSQAIVATFGRRAGEGFSSEQILCSAKEYTPPPPVSPKQTKNPLLYSNEKSAAAALGCSGILTCTVAAIIVVGGGFTFFG